MSTVEVLLCGERTYLSRTCRTPFEIRRSCCMTLALLTKMELLAKVTVKFPP